MISKENYQLLALDFGLPISSIKAIDEVESSGEGFDPETRKIKIQFEPSWFKKLAKILISNGVENQAKEWIAFNKAFQRILKKLWKVLLLVVCRLWDYTGSD